MTTNVPLPSAPRTGGMDAINPARARAARKAKNAVRPVTSILPMGYGRGLERISPVISLEYSGGMDSRTPPLRGAREGEVPAQRADGSSASPMKLMTPPSPQDADT